MVFSVVQASTNTLVARSPRHVRQRVQCGRHDGDGDTTEIMDMTIPKSPCAQLAYTLASMHRPIKELRQGQSTYHLGTWTVRELMMATWNWMRMTLAWEPKRRCNDASTLLDPSYRSLNN